MFYFADDKDLNRDQNGEADQDKGSLQFLKEQETEDAVYSVYLKKCTFNTLANDSADGGTDNGAFVNFRTKEVRVLKAGTLERIVDALAPESGELDSMLVRTFLSTYRCFAAARDVVDLLARRHYKLTECLDASTIIGGQQSPKAPVLSVLFIWLDLYPEDFDEPPDNSCLRMLDDFLQSLCARSPPSSQAADLRRTVGQMLKKLNGGCGESSSSCSSSGSGNSGSPTHDAAADSGVASESGSGGSSGSSNGVGSRQTPLRTSLLRKKRMSSSSGGEVPFPFGDDSVSRRSLTDEDSTSSRFSHFSLLSAEVVAEQLTLMDAELFVNVRLYQCLGSVWNQSGGSRGRNIRCSSVVATVEQFNNVIHRVMATVLKDIDLKHSKRAKIIEKWIEVARQLRSLKNFSSLRAVVSGLQSGAVYRLQKTWRRVGKEYRVAFEELSQIFSEDNNHVASRELLNKEGTAKMATTGSLDKQLSKRSSALFRTASKLFTMRSISTEQQGSAGSMCFGTVPYLGTFLTDLTMIDAALNDRTETGLINLEKRRREFDILAQIQLYQASAKLYHIDPKPDFYAWFHSCRTYSESESFDMSYAIEPMVTPAASAATTKSRVSRNNSSSFFYSLTSLTSLGDDDAVSSLDSSSASSECTATVAPQTLLSPPQSASGGSPHKSAGALAARIRRHSSQSSGSSDDLEAITTAMSADERLVRVHLETATPAGSDGGAPISCDSYKTMLLTNKTRAHNLIKTALEKYHADPEESSRYCLVQVLEKKKELLIPDDANVFYAMDNTQILSVFTVRPKPRPPTSGGGAATGPHDSVPSATSTLRRVNKNATFP